MSTLHSTTPSADITDEHAGQKAGEVLLWVLQVLTAAAFFMAAFPKITGSPGMVDLFEKIGIGQWFRYLVGTLEASGAAMLLIPGFAGSGALLLTTVMVGAIVTHMVKIGGSPTHAVEYLGLALLVAWFRREQVLRANSRERRQV